MWSPSGRGTTGAFRSSRADRGAQVVPPAGATVPPWLPAKSAHVSNLPACCALGPRRARPRALATMKLAAPVRHGRTLARLARPFRAAPHRGAALAARIAPLKQLHRRHVAAVGDQECALASARHKAGRRAHNGTITADCHKARGIEADPVSGLDSAACVRQASLVDRQVGVHLGVS